MKIIYLLLAFLILPAVAFSQPDNPYKDAQIINLGKDFNSKELDYAPYVSTDGTMFFVSNREGSHKLQDGKFSHDIWVALNKMNQDTAFYPPFNPDPPENKGKSNLNTAFNEGASCISLDKKVLYFTGCQRPNSLGDCDLYMAILTYSGDTIGIEKVHQMSRNINSEHWESQPSISPDNTRLYFASNRPLNPKMIHENNKQDQPHDMNIWYSDFNTETNQWQPAVPLPKEINTTGKEISPFIAADNRNLFLLLIGHLPAMVVRIFIIRSLTTRIIGLYPEISANP
ncbi:MAG: PD40 domain-containing protein [Ignavibacteria bacterium]|nr:PD40 domain-containing protein [Ignavibacteria bacterium]